MSIADFIECGCRIVNQHLPLYLDPETLGKLSGVRSFKKLFRHAEERGAKGVDESSPSHAIAAEGVRLIVRGETASLSRSPWPASEDAAIGAALVGYASHITSTQLCVHCPNNAAPRSKYCDIHAATDKRTRAGYRAGKRALEYVARSKSKNLLTARLMFRMALNQDFHKLIERELVFGPPRPKNWREYVEAWVSQYPQRLRGLRNEKSWRDVTDRLQLLLHDKHCVSQNPKIWNIKLQAAEAESVLREERKWLLHIRTLDLHEEIRALAQQEEINQAEVARRLGVSEPAVSKHVGKDDELRALFEKNRKNRSKSKWQKKGRSVHNTAV